MEYPTDSRYKYRGDFLKVFGKRILAALLAVLFLLALSGCDGHRIKVVSGDDLIVSCPRYAQAGEKVTVETVFVCDGWIRMSVNDSTTDVVHETDAEFTFTMPQGEAEIKAWVVSNGLA